MIQIKAEKKTLILCLVGVFSIGIIVAISTLNYLDGIKNYVTLEATIDDVYKETTRTSNGKTKRYTYIKYSYIYDGKDYETTVKAFSSIGNRKGTIENLKINPMVPTEIEEKKDLIGSILILVGCCFFVLFLVYAIIKKNQI